METMGCEVGPLKIRQPRLCGPRGARPCSSTTSLSVQSRHSVSSSARNAAVGSYGQIWQNVASVREYYKTAFTVSLRQQVKEKCPPTANALGRAHNESSLPQSPILAGQLLIRLDKSIVFKLGTPVVFTQLSGFPGYLVELKPGVAEIFFHFLLILQHFNANFLRVFNI